MDKGLGHLNISRSGKALKSITSMICMMSEWSIVLILILIIISLNHTVDDHKHNQLHHVLPLLINLIIILWKSWWCPLFCYYFYSFMAEYHFYFYSLLHITNINLAFSCFPWQTISYPYTYTSSYMYIHIRYISFMYISDYYCWQICWQNFNSWQFSWQVYWQNAPSWPKLLVLERKYFLWRGVLPHY